MRKLIFAGLAAAALAVVGGCVSPRWVESQVHGEVERAFTALQAVGAAATHGAVRFEMWSRTLEIERIAIDGGPGSGLALNVGRLKAEALASRGATVVAGAIDLADVEVSHTPADQSGWRIVVRVPALRLGDVVLPQQLPAGAEASDAAMVAGILQATRIAVVSAAAIEGIVVRQEAPPALGGLLPGGRPATATETYTWTNLHVERIGDGRIGALRADRIAIGGDRLSGSLESIAFADVDMLPLLGPSHAARRTGESGVFRVLGKASLAAGSMRAAASDIRLSGLAAEGIAVDRARFNTWRLLASASGLGTGGQAPTPEALAATAADSADLVEAVQIDRVALKELRLGSPQAPSAALEIGAVVLRGLERGKVQHFRIEGVSLPPSGAASRSSPPRLGTVGVDGLQLAQMMRAAAHLRQDRSRKPPELADLLGLIDGFELADTTVPDPVSGLPMHIDRLRVGWSRRAGGPLTECRLVLKGQWPLDARDPGQAPLVQHGLQAVRVDADVALRYEERAAAITLAPAQLSFGGIAAIEARLALVDLPRGVRSFDPAALAAAALGMPLGTAEVRISDRGLIGLLAVGSPREPGATARGQLLDGLRRDLDPGKPGTSLRAIIAALERFIGEPGQTLALTFAPRERVTLGELLQLGASGRGALQQALERFDVKASLGR